MRPTNREMKRFLRRQGWFIGPGEDPKLKGFQVSEGSMIDPVTGDLWGRGLLKQAFALAKERMAQAGAVGSKEGEGR